MTRFGTLMTTLFFALPVNAETLMAARTIRAHAVVNAEDVFIADADTPGALSALEDAVGLEARVVLYSNRPIRAGDVGPAAIIERNQIVTLAYLGGGLTISTDARSLGRAGPGDTLRVMNLQSRSTVSGRVGADGTVYVGY